MNFLRTSLTEHAIPRQEGIDAAEQVFSRFQDISHAEQLARLSLRVSIGKPGAFLSGEDRRELVRAHFLTNVSDSCSRALTIPGIVAVNMVSAEFLDDDLAFELREPFQEMPVLSLVHILHKCRQLDLKSK